MFNVGELVWVRNGLFLRNLSSGFGLIIQRHVLDLEECQMVSWFVLLDGKLVEIDSPNMKQLLWYNKHICRNDGFQGRAT